MRITVQAQAKINWALDILSRREDGYHEMDMLMQKIALSDEIRFETARWTTLTVNGHLIANAGKNLIVRAANLLNEYMGEKRGVRITLSKRIPVRAGLGGGSADCAAALLGLNELWNLKLPLTLLTQLGLKLGADVPFCLSGGFARVQGVGEILTPLHPVPHTALALVTPGGGLSTPAVFKAWNAGGFAPRAIDSAALAEALGSGDYERAQLLSRNDLEAPAIALMPEIAQCMAAFRAAGARYVRMSGSGSTVFAAFNSDAAAQAAASCIPGAIVTHTCAE